MSVSVADVLAVFPGAELVSCAWCGGSRWWHQASGAVVCVCCHPAPGRAPVLPPVRHVPSAARRRFASGLWHVCLRCGGTAWVHGDGDDRCAQCEP
jgi:hypothetical protein